MSNTFTTPRGTVLYLIDLKGKPYLPVQERIIWFREERPDWRILTHIVNHTDKSSIVRADVIDSNGNIMAQAHKTESAASFQDHLEKCETGAIGRALALVGFGTQFTALEFVEGDRLADAPAVEQRANPEPPAAKNPAPPAEPPQEKQPASPAKGGKPFVKPAFKVPASVEKNLANQSQESILPFGRDKGLRLREMSTKELISARDWAVSKNKFSEFVEHANTVLASRDDYELDKTLNQKITNDEPPWPTEKDQPAWQDEELPF